jgi:hypothetical protein
VKPKRTSGAERAPNKHVTHLFDHKTYGIEGILEAASLTAGLDVFWPNGTTYIGK